MLLQQPDGLRQSACAVPGPEQVLGTWPFSRRRGPEHRGWHCSLPPREGQPAALTPGAGEVRRPGSPDPTSKATRSDKENIWIHGWTQPTKGRDPDSVLAGELGRGSGLAGSCPLSILPIAQPPCLGSQGPPCLYPFVLKLLSPISSLASCKCLGSVSLTARGHAKWPVL